LWKAGCEVGEGKKVQTSEVGREIRRQHKLKNGRGKEYRRKGPFSREVALSAPLIFHRKKNCPSPQTQGKKEVGP